MNKLQLHFKNENIYQLSLFITFLLLSVLSIYFTFINNGQIIIGNDTNFHTLRIEDYSLASKNGAIFSYINKIALYGAGYAAPIFYSNFFLFPVSLVHALGLSLSTSIVIYLTFINLITFYISYWSFKQCNNNRTSSIIFSVFYTISTYRMVEITPRFAIGELFALTFMPLAFAGLYRIINLHKNSWILLSLGMSGIILAHHISALIFALLAFSWMVLSWKSITKNSCINFLKAVGLTILLTAFYLVPLIEQLLSQPFYLQKHPAFDISTTGMPVFTLIIDALKLNDLSIITIGLLSLIILVASWICFNWLNWNQRKILIISTTFLMFSTTLAPWEILAKTPLSYLQFPWRLFSIVTLLLAWLVADISKNINFNVKLFLPLIPILLLLITQISGNHTLYKKSYSDYNMVYVSRNGIQGAEFLPATLDEDLLRQLQVSRPATQTNGNWKFTSDEFINSSNEILLPIISYKGYQVMDNHNKELDFESYKGLIKLKRHPSQDVFVTYKGTLSQKISLIISLLCLIWLSAYTWLFRSNKKVQA